MHMGCEHIQPQQKADADQESDGGGKKSQRSHMRAAVQRGLQQTPKGSSNHYARGKTGERFLYGDGNLIFKEKNHRGSQGGAQERDQDSFYGLNIHLFCLRVLRAVTTHLLHSSLSFPNKSGGSFYSRKACSLPTF